MKKILELNDEDVGFDIKKGVKYESRIAARAILRKGKLIALMHVAKDDFYKLPGGGVEKGEDIIQALKREVKEETGCTLKLVGEIGETLEFRSHKPMMQISYCYLADVVKEGKQNLDKGEIEHGFKLIWVSIDKAIKLVGNSKPESYSYNGGFVVKRDLALLQEAKRYF